MKIFLHKTISQDKIVKFLFLDHKLIIKLI